MIKKIVHIAFFSFFISAFTSAYAVEGRPKMRRACLNKLDSMLTLSWFKPTDNCGSFTSFSLYGREDAFGLFAYMGNYTNFSFDNIQLKLKNQKNWEFYLVYNKTCNGIDSIFSDTLTIDNTPPVNTDLDSVSVDLATQKTIIGWPKNGSADVKGYYVYYITGINAIIDNTINTSILDNNAARNPTAASLAYGVAAYDSCENASIISNSHKTIYLQSNYNQCLKTITLSWSNYVGWDVQDYIIYRKINGGNYQQIGTVVSNINQFTYNFTNFGDNLCFYVRAVKQGNPLITSSSNTTCLNTNSITPSINSYIAKASVQNNAVELTLITQTLTSLEKLNIYRAVDNGSFSIWQIINFTGGTLDLIDNNVNVNTRNYSYYFTTEGPCNLIFDTSQIAKTILLKIDMPIVGTQNLDWNTYFEFIKNTEKQELLLLNNPNGNKSSSWNILNTFSNSTIFRQDNSTFSPTMQQLCYCIRAIENNATAQYNRKDTSYSNIQCATADPIVYFPNAIQINGFNTEFYPQGVFLDYEKSSFQVFNRWGELVYETNDIRKAWKGTGNNGELVDQDVYIYRSTIIGINGKKLIFDGTITVLK